MCRLFRLDRMEASNEQDFAMWPQGSSHKTSLFRPKCPMAIPWPHGTKQAGSGLAVFWTWSVICASILVPVLCRPEPLDSLVTDLNIVLGGGQRTARPAKPGSTESAHKHVQAVTTNPKGHER